MLGNFLRAHLSRMNQYFQDEIEEDEAFLSMEIEEKDLDEQGRHKRNRIQRNRGAAHARFHDFYFAEEPLFGPIHFNRRYRMSRELFLHICDKLQTHNRFWVQRFVCLIQSFIFHLDHSSCFSISHLLLSGLLPSAWLIHNPESDLSLATTCIRYDS